MFTNIIIINTFKNVICITFLFIIIIYLFIGVIFMFYSPFYLLLLGR